MTVKPAIASLLIALAASLASAGAAAAAPPPPDTIPVEVSPTSGPRGAKFVAKADVTADPRLTITWDLDGDKLDGEKTGIAFTSDQLGSHRIRITVTNGTSTATGSALITVVNLAPVATIGASPAAPKTGDRIALTAPTTDADGDSLTCAWDLDGNGAFETPGCGTSASRPKAGAFTVGLRVDDGQHQPNSVDTATRAITVANRPPVATFTADPTSVLTGQTVSFDSAAASDPDGTIVARSWDLDGDGDFDDGSSTTATFQYATAGSHTVRLKVIDDNGGTTVGETTIDVQAAPAAPVTPAAPAAPAAPPALAPAAKAAGTIAATLRYGFTRTSNTTTFSTLLIRNLTGGEHIHAACQGGGCPKKAIDATAKSSTLDLKKLRGLKLKVGAVVTVKITKSGLRSRTIKLTVRKGKDPKLS